MNSDLTLTINHIRAIVDTYSAGAHPLPALIDMRRELAVFLFRLTGHVKSSYGGKLKSYIRRKHGVARAIITAMEEDIKVMGKAKAMNYYDTATEALDHVRQAKTEEAEADAEWEQLRYTIDIAKQILAAMQQEISDLKTEKSNPSYQNTGS
jgi:hypothetical protein